MKCFIILFILLPFIATGAESPNIVSVFPDDHAVKPISAYGLNEISRLAPPLNTDRISKGGAVVENNFCANSMCAPSRCLKLNEQGSGK
jgi:arylsulfatase A-like enzyme